MKYLLVLLMLVGCSAKPDQGQCYIFKKDVSSSRPTYAQIVYINSDRYSDYVSYEFVDGFDGLYDHKDREVHEFLDRYERVSDAMCRNIEIIKLKSEFQTKLDDLQSQINALKAGKK